MGIIGYIVIGIIWAGFHLYMNWKHHLPTPNWVIAACVLAWPLMGICFIFAMIEFMVHGSRHER